MTRSTVLLMICSAFWMLAGCGRAGDEKLTSPSPSPQQNAPAAASARSIEGPESGLPPPTEAPADDDDGHVSIELRAKPWKGDLDGMIERRVIRVLVPYSKTFYFIDRGAQRGLSYELMHEFGNIVNKTHKLTRLPVATVFLPVSRDELIAHLNAGLGDVAAANLTVTPERSAQVDFSLPLATGVKEIVVTSADAPALTTLDDLSGREVFIRRSSSYFEHLQAFNADLRQRGKAPVGVRETPGNFEDEDVLEMVNAGLVQYTIVDRYLASFWGQIYTAMKPREDLVLNEQGDIAFALRKDSPRLKAELDAFIKTHKRGTTFGNVVTQKYLKDTRWVKNSTTEAEMKKFDQLAQLFRKYGDQYRVDWLLMAAQGYQESRLDQKVKSSVGAIGVMQVMPATGKDMKVGDIGQIEPNIHAGVKYTRFMIDEYYKDEPMDDLNKVLFAFASYNAGPNRIRGLRQQAQKRGLNPNVWFDNVERIAAEKIGRETVQYVSNIYKYYIAYNLALEQIRRDREHDRKTADAQQR